MTNRIIFITFMVSIGTVGVGILACGGHDQSVMPTENVRVDLLEQCDAVDARDSDAAVAHGRARRPRGHVVGDEHRAVFLEHGFDPLPPARLFLGRGRLLIAGCARKEAAG